MGFSDSNGLERIGWGTWIRTKIDGVRVRSSTVELFPSSGARRGHAEAMPQIAKALADCKARQAPSRANSRTAASGVGGCPMPDDVDPLPCLL